MQAKQIVGRRNNNQKKKASRRPKKAKERKTELAAPKRSPPKKRQSQQTDNSIGRPSQTHRHSGTQNQIKFVTIFFVRLLLLLRRLHRLLSLANCLLHYSRFGSRCSEKLSRFCFTFFCVPPIR